MLTLIFKQNNMLDIDLISEEIQNTGLIQYELFCLDTLYSVSPMVSNQIF